MANLPGTIWQKIVPFFGAPPQWVPAGNFFSGVKGDPGLTIKGERGLEGRQGPQGLPTLPRGWIDGLIMSNDVGFTDYIDIAAGSCADSGNAIQLTLPAFIKNVNAAWVAGSGNGGKFAGSFVSGTTFHCFVIGKTDGTVDAGFDTSITAANIPAGYTLYRRIGSIVINATPHVTPFHQYGGEFWYDTSILDINATNPGTAAVTRTLTLPTGLQMQGILTMNCFSSTLNIQGYLSHLDSVDLAASYANAIEDGAGDTTIEGLGPRLRVWTNTSAQIRSRLSQSDANTVVKIRTLGWIDFRGANS